MNLYCKFVLLIFVSVVVAFAAVSLMAEEKPAESKKVYWKIAGQLEEACKCNAACPCWFGSKPTHMNCGGQLVYFITKGKYGDASLDGLAFARTGQSPDGQAMMDAFGNWVFDYSYIDEKANAEQRKALEEISWMIMSKASANVKVLYVPITRKIDGNVHQITIGEVGTFSAHLMEGGLGGTPKISNAPGADPIRAEFQQGTTDAFKYTDASQNWNSQGSNYMFTNFEVDSEQYEKFNSMMMQKMEEMKKKKGTEHHH
ncbi:DUF1326 domain-containing protein [bacterium]|nr:DUF1326 domain-containing protein [bacterium]MCI0601718.1 DUF1326 domain-containing protein [bacterium]